MGGKTRCVFVREKKKSRESERDSFGLNGKQVKKIKKSFFVFAVFLFRVDFKPTVAK